MADSITIAPQSVLTFLVPDTTINVRIDHYLKEQIPHYSRCFLQQLIVDKHVSVNAKTVTKPSTLISCNDAIVVEFPLEKVPQLETIIDKTMGVSILHAAEHFMIIHKPAHLLIHTPSTRSEAITLVDWIKHNHQELKSVGSIDRPGIIHRLDKETSGLLIITRTNYAHQTFGQLFQNRQIYKTYHALVVGHPDKEGVVELSIGRNPHNRTKMTTYLPDSPEAIKRKSRNAKTYYTVLEYYNNAALIELKPVTGRTHQIRVHMASLGHPLIGDQLYGSKSSLIGRHALHAHHLSFEFDGTHHSFFDELPHDFQHAIDTLRTSDSAL